ncbi:hypothetical protein DB313_05305 (plasmid) [Borrelia turcica IST7]|uniref:Uncharacterized protein n=1 Tax=Borrelia turcica IST7 TaxID=1104446 RepID=A0A386PNU4_9SPIR|nr:plasmid maintenance protein [Borrelia turcica]AYE36918.1 hypothetical protein DB313_05305 [Borrelia turcica IST7]
MNIQQRSKKIKTHKKDQATFSILQKLTSLNESKIDNGMAQVSITYAKSMILKKDIILNRLKKICWAIETKNKEYISSKGTKEYSAKDIRQIVNSCLIKDGLKPVAISTMRGDIAKLKKIGLLKTWHQSLGEGNGSIARYIQNREKWPSKDTLIKAHLEKELIECFKNKIIVDNFIIQMEKENSKQSSLPKPRKSKKENSQEQIEQGKLSNGGVQNSDLISKDIRSLYKYKNSKKSTLKKEEENRTDAGKTSKNRAKSNSSTKTRPKIAYKTTYEEYMEVRLESSYRVSKATMAKIRCNSNNVNTYRNALRNLEAGILVYGRDYLIGDIVEHFTSEFVNGYKGKVWMMNPNTAKTNDFYKIWGMFTDKYTNKYKQQEMLARRAYYDGYGNMSELDANGRFIEGSVKLISGLLDKFRQDINKDSVI